VINERNDVFFVFEKDDTCVSYKHASVVCLIPVFLIVNLCLLSHTFIIILTVHLFSFFVVF